MRWREFWRAIKAWRTARLVMKRAGWTDADGRELARFLASDTGRRVGITMRDLILRTALEAMNARGENLPWEAGRAAGMRDLASYLDALQMSKEEPKANLADDRPSEDLNWLHGNHDEPSRTG